MDFQDILYEIRNGVAWITINRPEKMNAFRGTTCDETLDKLRVDWLKATDPAKQKRLLDAFHARAWEALPYVNVGQYSPAQAVRKAVSGSDKLSGGLPLIWMLDK